MAQNVPFTRFTICRPFHKEENGAENGWSVITVSDNGPGLDTEKAGSAFHIGLQNVRERLRMMSGGSLELQSAPAVGTTVTVRLPPPDMGGNGG
jgi:sensor histidine kinase YesM